MWPFASGVASALESVEIRSLGDRVLPCAQADGTAGIVRHEDVGSPAGSFESAVGVSGCSAVVRISEDAPALEGWGPSGLLWTVEFDYGRWPSVIAASPDARTVVVKANRGGLASPANLWAYDAATGRRTFSLRSGNPLPDESRWCADGGAILLQAVPLPGEDYVQDYRTFAIDLTRGRILERDHPYDPGLPPVPDVTVTVAGRDVVFRGWTHSLTFGESSIGLDASVRSVSVEGDELVLLELVPGADGWYRATLRRTVGVAQAMALAEQNTQLAIGQSLSRAIQLEFDRLAPRPEPQPVTPARTPDCSTMSSLDCVRAAVRERAGANPLLVDAKNDHNEIGQGQAYRFRTGDRGQVDVLAAAPGELTEVCIGLEADVAIGLGFHEWTTIADAVCAPAVASDGLFRTVYFGFPGVPGGLDAALRMWTRGGHTFGWVYAW